MLLKTFSPITFFLKSITQNTISVYRAQGHGKISRLQISHGKMTLTAIITQTGGSLNTASSAIQKLGLHSSELYRQQLQPQHYHKFVVRVSLSMFSTYQELLRVGQEPSRKRFYLLDISGLHGCIGALCGEHGTSWKPSLPHNTLKEKNPFEFSRLRDLVSRKTHTLLLAQASLDIVVMSKQWKCLVKAARHVMIRNLL